MSQISLVSDSVDLVDEAGEVLAKVPTLDLYYLIASTIEAETKKGANLPQAMKEAANLIEAEYEIKLTWGQVMDILSTLDPIVESAKKKSIATQK